MRTHSRMIRNCSYAALALLGCQKEAPQSESKESAPVAASAPERAADPRNPAEPTPSAIASMARAPSNEQPFMGQELRVGKYVETSAYKIRVDKVVRCADPAPTETVPEDRKVRVAAKVAIFSKYDDFFVSPQDVVLDKDGVIINSESKVKTSAECAPLLDQKRVNHDQTLEGFVVFQVPDEAFVKNSVVAFKPTRWGGAPRTEIKVEAKDFVAAKAEATPTTK